MRLACLQGVVSILWVVWLATAAFAADWEAVRRLADTRLAAVAGRIEVVRINGQLSHLEYYQQPVETPVLPSPLPQWSLPAVEPIPYGSLEVVGNGTFRKGSGPGGLLVPLAPQAGTLNLLPYHVVTIDSTSQGVWQVALADEQLVRQQDNWLLGSLASASGQQIFSLAAVPATFDRAKGRYLVFRLASTAGSLGLKNITLQRTAVNNRAIGRGAWLWDVRLLLGHEQALLEKLQRNAISRLYLQVDDQLQRLTPFLRLARAQGIAVYALDGAPDAHLQSEALLRRIASVAAFNRAYPQLAFSGFQLDVEPYLQKDFSLDQSRHLAAYLALLDAARRQAGVNLPISAAIPFWFAQVATPGRDLAQEVLQRVDEVVVMAYRREYEQVLQISTPILAAGEWAGKPVWLGVELTALPDEDHLVLLPAAVGDRSDLELAGRHWRSAHQYQVKGATLSFAGAPELLPGLLQQRPPFGSFQGWVVHSLDLLEATR